MMPPAPAEPVIHAVALDMDGLLATSEDIYLRVGTELLRRRGKAFEDDLRHQMMGMRTPMALQLMIDHHELPESVEQLADESEQIFWSEAKDRLAPMPGVDGLFELMDRQRLPRGVVTSGMRSYAERILTIIGVRDRLEFLITADDVELGKPHPEPYLMAAEQLGVEPAHLLVLEDSSNGCKAGIAAGAYTVAVPSPHTTEHDFTGTQFVAKTLRDPRLVALLEANGGHAAC